MAKDKNVTGEEILDICSAYMSADDLKLVEKAWHYAQGANLKSTISCVRMIEQTQDIDRKRTLMSQLTLVYISLSGNTQSFVKRMSDYLSLNHGIECRQINIKELNNETFQVDEPFVELLPTYLEGGNGVDNGDVEILTNPLGDR